MMKKGYTIQRNMSLISKSEKLNHLITSNKNKQFKDEK
jgi:hypothetical protein